MLLKRSMKPMLCETSFNQSNHINTNQCKQNTILKHCANNYLQTKQYKCKTEYITISAGAGKIHTLQIVLSDSPVDDVWFIVKLIRTGCPQHKCICIYKPFQVSFQEAKKIILSFEKHKKSNNFLSFWYKIFA